MVIAVQLAQRDKHIGEADRAARAGNVAERRAGLDRVHIGRLAACRTEGSILVSAADGVADHGDRGDHSGCR